MEGEIIYSFPIFRAIECGYIKRLKAKVLNPTTLRYVRNNGDEEVEVSLEEIRTLGENDAAFRRSIVSSDESLNTIVDCSIRELYNIHEVTGDSKHKIIASALNMKHCIQITAAYRARGMRADYIHSLREGRDNKRILKKLENHELDVIVQVRMLGEGFDHPYLSIAAVCSVFSNLSPFAQFIGRIMRVVDQNDPESPNNQGVVVFHAGSNIAQRWSDFQHFSEADRGYFEQLLPIENVDFESSDEILITPRQRNNATIKITEQANVSIQELSLIDSNDNEAFEALELLKSRGLEVTLKRIPETKQRRRRASRSELDAMVKTSASEVLSQLSLSAGGRELDTSYIGLTNFIVVKASIDRHINKMVGKKSGQRHEFTQAEMDEILDKLDEIALQIQKELYNVTT